ncbi:MAG: hypothetical protein QG604_593 [Candidatus Dependentiae bacterium]|nr:hypothetical protein [Candidatus Dependentiae bacterium]
MILLLLLCTVLCLPSYELCARRAPRKAAVKVVQPVVEKKAAPDLDRLTGQYRDIDMLVEEAKRKAEHEKRLAKRTEEELEAKVRRHQSRFERRREEMLARDAKQQVLLEQKAREEAAEASKQAEEKARLIITDAERKAAALKVALEEEAKEDKKAGRTPITKEWRREIAKDFEKDAGFIRTVVMEGEVIRVERQNFIALFNEQQAWLTQKVAEAEFFFDEAYNAVVTKRNAVAAVVDAQRQADDLILDMVNEYHFPAKVQSQLRLMALYEINNHMQNSPNPSIFLAADVIENLVHKISIDVAPGKRDITIVTEKEKVVNLESRIAELETKLNQEGAAQESVLEKSEQIVSMEGQLIKMKKERDEMLIQIGAQEQAYTQALGAKDEAHAQERGSLIEVLENKERDKAELEIQLAQISEHMKILTTRSQSRLITLAEQLTDKAVTEKELRAAVESKARKQAELEISLAQVNQEIAQLRRTSTEVVTVLTDQLNTLQDKCRVLGELFEEKQKESIELELEVKSAKEVNLQVLEQVSVYANQLEQAQQECGTYRSQIETLQKAVADLSGQNEGLNVTVDSFKEQVIKLTEKSQRKVAMLMEMLQLHQKELNERRAAYGEMAKLQATLEKARRLHADDTRRAATHAHLLSQMATFGDKLLADYNQLHNSAHNVRHVHQQLVDLLCLVRDCQQEPDHTEVLRSLEMALQLLSEASTDIAIPERQTKEFEPIVLQPQQVEVEIEVIQPVMATEFPPDQFVIQVQTTADDALSGTQSPMVE